MGLDIRAYDAINDFDQVARIWREVGWIEDNERHREALRYLLAAGAAEVGLIDGQPECLVHRTPGTIHYEREPLPLCAITAVATSLVGRKYGFASKLTARALAAGAHTGAAVAALGMFEQGFYDRLGFGTGSYDHQVAFDPRTLRVGHVPYRPPARLGPEHAGEICAALAARHKHHGAVVLESAELVASELHGAENGFTLGYRDAAGTLTHLLFGDLKDEHGPFKVRAMAYRTNDQLLELLRLLYELSDQFRSVTMMEPADIQLQTLLDEPFRQEQRSRRSDMASGNRALAWWQLRIIDLDRCVAARRWPGPTVSFNLELTDPAAGLLDGWRGIGGSYSVDVGPESSIGAGVRSGLDTVTCDVGAFTRLWFGVAPASSLRVTDRFDAGDQVCDQLDEVLRLPPVIAGWQF